MTKTFDRVMIIMMFSGALVIVLGLLARTGFADTVDSANLSYASSWIEPARQVMGSTMIAVPAVLVIQELWQKLFGKKPERIPAR